MDLFAAGLDSSRFDKFNVITKIYKSIDEHDIELDILYSKALDPSSTESNPAPILLRFHGGGMVSGSSLFPPFFAPWLLQLVERYKAVIVSPNYRLIPESTLGDALDDVEDAWKWLHESLPTVLQEEAGLAVDTNRIMTTGDSAGGYLSLLTGLRHADAIRTVHASYPMVDLTNPFYTGRYRKATFGQPEFPESIISEHLEKISGTNKMVSADTRLDRGPLIFALVQRGLLGPYFPPERREYYVFRCLEDGARFPRGGVLVWHGRDDSLVPVDQSLELERLVTEMDPDLPFRLVIRDGEHGFDHETDIDDDWARQSLITSIQVWLA